MSYSLKYAAIAWANQYLQRVGYTPEAMVPEKVLSTPWSDVLCFATSRGAVYLKQTPMALSLEAPIFQLLGQQLQLPVPVVLAHNASLRAFLTCDAGIPLRQHLKQQFHATLLAQAIRQFSCLQLRLVSHVDLLQAMGVPDWRLKLLPALYVDLLSQEAILYDEGVTRNELVQLQQLVPQVFRLCQQLAKFNLPETLVQCDFHDNNVLIAPKKQSFTFIDLGEVVISQPLFSLVGCLRQAKKHYGIASASPVYTQLLQAGLECYMADWPESVLLEAFAIARVLWWVYDALAQYRLRLACDEGPFLAFQTAGKLRATLQSFIGASSGVLP